MKNAKFENLMEARSVEPSSLNYDDVFSSIQKIDYTAHQLAKEYEIPVETIYETIQSFDPAAYIEMCANDPDSLIFNHFDVMRDLQLITSKSDKGYGEPIKEFFNDDWAQLGRKANSTEGEVVKKREIVLDEGMGFYDKLIISIGKHPYMSAAGILLVLFGGGGGNRSSPEIY